MPGRARHRDEEPGEEARRKEGLQRWPPGDLVEPLRIGAQHEQRQRGAHVLPEGGKVAGARRRDGAAQLRDARLELGVGAQVEVERQAHQERH